MSSATTTGVESVNGSVSRRNGLDMVQTSETKSKTPPQRKYRHVAAVHSKTRPSCLSHDSDAAPSFIGFRNLMVIVLGTLSRPRFALE